MYNVIIRVKMAEDSSAAVPNSSRKLLYYLV